MPCPVCDREVLQENCVSCNQTSHDHEICLWCFFEQEKTTPPSMHIKCCMCRGQITHGLFRMESFGAREERNVAEQIQIMRSEQRNVAQKMSEWNFVAFICALILLNEKADDDLYDFMPACVKKYLDSAEENKRSEWYDSLRLVARNLHYEMLNDEIPIERNGCRTSCAAEDAILFIIWQRSEEGHEFDPNTIITQKLGDAEELLESLSKVDPGDDEDDGEYDEDDDVQEREDIESNFEEAMDAMMDDMDIAFLWDFNTEFRFQNSDYVFSMPSGVEITYSRWREIREDTATIRMHPDCWFIVWQEIGPPLEPEVDNTDNVEIVGEKRKIVHAQ